MDLFPSTLIICPNVDKINQYIGKICNSLDQVFSPNNPDIYIIDQNTGWTIELVRQLKNFLAQKPFNHANKIAFILNAHNLNNESQNALLKTIEEPGLNNFIVITTNKPSKLLPTIISRCHTIKISHKSLDTKTKPIEISSDIKKNLATSETISKNKDQVLPFLEEQLKIHQQILMTNPSPQTSNIIKKIIKAIQMINANVDPRSALDFIFLS